MSSDRRLNLILAGAAGLLFLFALALPPSLMHLRWPPLHGFREYCLIKTTALAVCSALCLIVATRDDRIEVRLCCFGVVAIAVYIVALLVLMIRNAY